jgi:alpha-amylase/alpha-mannosidase (GH57 family)
LVFQQSYQPLLAFLLESRQAHLTLNITASLLEQLGEWGMGEWLERLRKLVLSGQVELTGTAAYHPLLPKLPREERVRQIKLEEAALRRLFPRSDLRREGLIFKGFFPPEMAVDEGVVELVGALGYRWVVVDESAVAGKYLKSRIYNLKLSEGKGGRVSGLKVIVRHKEFSLKLAFGAIKTLDDFSSALKLYILDSRSYILLALDGETFGHHHPELLPWLGELLANSGKGEYRLVTVSELIGERHSFEPVKVHPSTWADGWERWNNPDNAIHQKQWQLTELALRVVQSSKYKVQSDFLEPTLNRLSQEEKQWLKARYLLDRALHSDQYWWASARPNWHYKMVERGAKMLREVVLAVPEVKESEVIQTDHLYNGITKLGLEKYGDTVIA